MPLAWVLRRDKERQKEEPVITQQDWEMEALGFGQ